MLPATGLRGKPVDGSQLHLKPGGPHCGFVKTQFPPRLSSMQKGYFLVSPCSVVLVLLTSTVALFLSWREEWTKARKERQEGEAGLACGVESEGTASGAEGEEKRRVPG